MTVDIGQQIVLSGVLGSHAHGLDNEFSDIDTGGVFSYPTEDLLRFNVPRETIDGHDPDFHYHEIKKFLSLAMKGNPSALEVLYLDEYDIIEDYWGERLLSINDMFLSQRILPAYCGFAHAQMKRTFRNEWDTNKRNKSIRHVFRLMQQAHTLYTEGIMTVKVPDPSAIEALYSISNEDLEYEFTLRDLELRDAVSVLPKEPNLVVIEQYLLDYRNAH